MEFEVDLEAVIFDADDKFEAVLFDWGSVLELNCELDCDKEVELDCEVEGACKRHGKGNMRWENHISEKKLNYFFQKNGQTWTKRKITNIPIDYFKIY